LAQDSGGDRVNQLIVFGNDPCPPPADGEITVCARKNEGERYRIPEALRQSDAPDNDAWNNRVLAYETVGRNGTLSCSPVGASGMTGCVSQLIKTAYAEKGMDPTIRFSQLIAIERAKRLSTIDAEAAETQARVEQLEKEYEERERARQDPSAAQPQPISPQPASGK
jgi:hypothetical protein